MIKELFRKHSFKVNALFSFLYQTLKVLIPLITTPYIARVLGSDNVGEYSYTYSIFYFFLIVATFGFTDYGNLVVSRVRGDKHKTSIYFWSIMSSKGLLTLLSAIAYLPTIWFISAGSSNALFLYLSIGFALIGTMLDPSFILMGEEEYVSISIRDMIMRLLTAGAIFAFVRNDSFSNLVIYASITSVGTLLSALIVIPPSKKYIQKVNIKELNLKETFWQSLIFFIPTLFSSVYMNLNKTLIGIYSPDSVANYQNAIYDNAVKIMTIVTSALGSINSLITSRIANDFYKKGISAIKKNIEKSIHLILLLALPCFFGLILIAKNFVPVFFGSGYEGTVNVIYALSPNIISIPLAWVILSAYYIPTGKRGLANWINVFVAIVDLISCVALIPIYNAVGAAISYSITEFLQLILFIHYSKKDINWKSIFSSYAIKPFDISLFMGCVILAFNNFSDFNNLSNLLISITLGVFLYFLLILITKDELMEQYLLNPIKSRINKLKARWSSK